MSRGSCCQEKIWTSRILDFRTPLIRKFDTYKGRNCTKKWEAFPCKPKHSRGSATGNRAGSRTSGFLPCMPWPALFSLMAQRGKSFQEKKTQYVTSWWTNHKVGGKMSLLQVCTEETEKLVPLPWRVNSSLKAIGFPIFWEKVPLLMTFFKTEIWQDKQKIPQHGQTLHYTKIWHIFLLVSLFSFMYMLFPSYLHNLKICESTRVLLRAPSKSNSPD